MMAKLNDDWNVPEHGPVRRVADGILTVEGSISMPLGKFPRRMTMVRLDGRGSAIWSAMPLREESMREVEALGVPRYLIVPNAHHRLDVRAWKHRYPDARVLAPGGARDAVGEALHVDGDEQALIEPGARLLPVPGTAGAEFAFEVRRGDGLTLIVNDVIAHVAHPQGLGAQLMARLMGFGVTKPAVPRVARRMLVRDPAALAGQFRAWSADGTLQRIVPSHGDIIEDPASVLTDLADRLAG
jgi:hypothetical protein